MSINIRGKGWFRRHKTLLTAYVEQTRYSPILFHISVSVLQRNGLGGQFCPGTLEVTIPPVDPLVLPSGHCSHITMNESLFFYHRTLWTPQYQGDRISV